MIREAFFVDLAAKCFAYLPCSEGHPSFRNIWANVGDRRVGACHLDYKVVVFANHTDYQTYIRKSLERWQFNMLYDKLKYDYSELISLNKSKDLCFDQFKDITHKIAESFNDAYLNIKKEHKLEPDSIEESIPELEPEPKLEITTTKSESSSPVFETTTLIEVKKNDSLIVLDYNGKTIEMSLLFFVILCAVVFLGLVVWIAFIVIHVKKIFSDYKLIRNKSSNTLLDNFTPTPTKQIPCV